jgi:hypothetical protein
VGDGKWEVGDEKNKNIEVKFKDKLLTFLFYPRSSVSYPYLSVVNPWESVLNPYISVVSYLVASYRALISSADNARL